MGNLSVRIKEKVFVLFYFLAQSMRGGQRQHEQQSSEQIEQQNINQQNEILECPNCKQQFDKDYDNNQFNQHLDQCLRNNKFNNQDLSQQVGTRKIFRIDKQSNNQAEIEISSEEVAEIFRIDQKSIKNYDFGKKTIWIRYQLSKRKISWVEGSDFMLVDKADIVGSTLQMIDVVDMLREIKIQFDNEQVADAGGLIREWIHLLVKQLFSSQEGIFQNTNKRGVYFKSNIEYTERNIQKVRLAGKIIAKAIMERIPIDVGLNPIFIKQILGKDIDMEDFENYDTEIYNTFQYIVSNNVNDDEFLQSINFVQMSQMDGKYIEEELIEGGYDIYLSEENKYQYIENYVDHVVNKKNDLVLNVLLSEFYEIVPKAYIEILTVEEFEMIMNGLQKVDVDDWQSNTIYKGKYSQSHQIVEWFWKIVREELQQEQIQKIIQFTTGLKKLPVEGFGYLESNRGNICKFTIQEGDTLQAMTCFNRLQIPEYQSYEEMKAKMVELTSMQFEGVFGLND